MSGSNLHAKQLALFLWDTALGNDIPVRGEQHHYFGMGQIHGCVHDTREI